MDFSKSSFKNFKITLVSRNNNKNKIDETYMDSIQNTNSTNK